MLSGVAISPVLRSRIFLFRRNLLAIGYTHEGFYAV
jgi:hypothetical protein